MKKALIVSLLVVLAGGAIASAATEQAKQQAIDDGLAWLAANNSSSATEVYWPYGNNGTLAATASAALAFIEEGYLPGNDVVIGATNYGDVVGKACNYIFNRATAMTIAPETAVYWRDAEDYNNNGAMDDGGNRQGIYFNSGNSQRDVYTTGIAVPVVYALGNALGVNTQVNMGNAVVQNMTYKQAMRDLVDWFSFAQVEPNRGVHRGGWRYYANQTTSDNSTAQWGALPMLYAADPAWNLPVPQYVKNELALWCAYIQNANGGSGYDNPGTYVNISKTGGLLLELAAIGRPLSDPAVQAALNYINNNWTQARSATWYGNLDHPYAMWAVYKALEVYGFTMDYGSTAGEDFPIGFGITPAPGGITIGQDWWATPGTSLAGDWFSQYCDLLVANQNANGSWNGYTEWTGALATGWYINILNAAGAPEPVEEVIPEPLTMLGVFLGVGGIAGYIRRRRSA